MKWALSFFAAAGLAASSFSAGQDTPRIAAIWGHALDRLTLQNDYWFEDGDFPRTIQSLRLMHAIYPSDYEVATNLGWLLESTDQNGEALVTYIRYAKLNPSDPDSAYPEANFYFMKRAYARVPAILEPTIDKRPHPNSFRLLAHSYERLGMFKDSARVWNAYMKLAPEDLAAKANLSRVEKKMKGEPLSPGQRR